MSISLSNKRVAVTGPSGFIGLHLLHRLHAAGAEIVAIEAVDRPVAKLRALPFSMEIVELADLSQLGDAVRDSRANWVIHLSAVISLDRGLQTLEKTLYSNLMPTLALLTASTEIKADRVLLMGSCEEYGQKYCPFDTALAADPNSPYGASKAAATAYARMFYGSFALPTVVLRPSVVYGPWQSPRQLIPMVFGALAANKKIDVTAGRQTRDFVFIDDMIDAMLIAMIEPAVVGETWNIGSGEVVTVRQCLELMEKITGRYGLIQYGARPYADSERFHYEPMVDGTYEALKWRPSVMLEEGLRRTWASFLSEG